MRYNNILFYYETNENMIIQEIGESWSELNDAVKSADQQEIVKKFVQYRSSEYSSDMLASDLLLKINTDSKMASTQPNYSAKDDISLKVTPETKKLLNQLYLNDWNKQHLTNLGIINTLFECKRYDLSCTLLSSLKEQINQAEEIAYFHNKVNHYNLTHLEEYQKWNDLRYTKEVSSNHSALTAWYQKNPGKLKNR